MALQVVEDPRIVQVPYTVTFDDGSTYRDALTFTQAEFTASTAATRRAMMVERARQQQAAVKAAATAPPEEPAARRRRLRRERADLLEAQARIDRDLADAEDPAAPEA